MDRQTLNAELLSHFGFSSFKGNQEQIILNLLEGKDTFVLMPTGGGKSLCYQLPALMKEGTAIVISPLIALMKNQVDAMRGYSEDNGVAHFLNSSLNKQQVNEVKSDILSGKTKLLYVAPESLTKEENIQFLKTIKISFYAIDEAHCISEWGHDFRPEYRRIHPIIEEIGVAPVIALTATATPKVQADIQKNLGMMDATVFKSSFNRTNLYYEVRPKTSNVNNDIVKILKSNEGKSAIVYCLSRKKVEEMAELLTTNGIRALPYHAGLDASTRAENQDRFLMEDCDVICATIAFGMGIDKPDVRLVIHYDIPKSLEGYYQETGRAGRDGGEGRCITFFSHKDIQKLEKFLQGKPQSEVDVGKQLIAETIAYAESSICRRRSLMNYFGEVYEKENCGACDNCLSPKEKFNATESVLMLMEVAEEMDNKLKADELTDFMTGKAADYLKKLGYTQNELFGCGKEKESKYWTSVIRQSLVEGLLRKQIENQGVIRITEKGRAYMDKHYTLFFTMDREFNCNEDEVAPNEGGGSVLDEALFKMLKSLRKDEGARLGLLPHILFTDPILEDMTTYYPMTLQELQGIPGVNENKANKFGKPFVELIARYVTENEIERPMNIVVKTMPTKSKSKVEIIKRVDLQNDLRDIAKDLGVGFEELLDEMERIVYGGTNLNIDYYLPQELEQDEIDELYDYFVESDTDDLKTAVEAFEGAYDEPLVRLVRLKYISEVAN